MTFTNCKTQTHRFPVYVVSTCMEGGYMPNPDSVFAFAHKRDAVAFAIDEKMSYRDDGYTVDGSIIRDGCYTVRPEDAGDYTLSTLIEMDVIWFPSKQEANEYIASCE